MLRDYLLLLLSFIWILNNKLKEEIGGWKIYVLVM